MSKLFCAIVLFLGYIHLHAQVPLTFNITETTPFPDDVHGFAINPNDSTLYFTSLHSGDLSKLEYPYSGTYSNTGVRGQRLAGLLWLNQSLYVADLSEGVIKQFDASLNLITTHIVPSPWNMASDGQSIYVVTFSGELYKITANNQVQLLRSGLAYPFDIKFSPNNTLYISEQHGSNVPGSISEFDLAGNLLHKMQNVYVTPLGITFDKAGNLYVVDNNTNCIYCIDPNGNTHMVSCSYDKPIAIISNLSDNLFVSTAASGGALLEVNTNLETSLLEFEASDLLLFPNPTKDLLYISIQLNHQATPEIEVYSFEGKKFLIEEVNQHQVKGKLEITINTEKMTPGNYVLKIEDPKFKVTRQFSICH